MHFKTLSARNKFVKLLVQEIFTFNNAGFDAVKREYTLLFKLIYFLRVIKKELLSRFLLYWFENPKLIAILYLLSRFCAVNE